MLLPFTRWAATGRKLALLAGLLGTAALPATAQLTYGLSTPSTSPPPFTNLVSFDLSTPGTFIATVPVTGLAAGQTLVGLDARPTTGELFALGYNPTGTQAQLYTLNATTAVLKAVGTPLTLNLGTSTDRIGFDFNPTVD
jgi:hypothetical protein